MRNVKILFFAADPLSALPDGPDRLLLDEDVRQIHQRVRASEHRDRLHFDVRWAARTKDLLQALNEAHPQVVHFSGHGGNRGLVVVGSDGYSPHSLPPSALVRVFRSFRKDVRVVVLNACFSLAQAKAVAETVGCAIGTPTAIPDAAAITFGAAFYSAIGFGCSVEDAYDQACAALDMDGFDAAVFPQLVVRPGVEAGKLFLIPPEDLDDADLPARGKERGGEPGRRSAPVLAAAPTRRRALRPVAIVIALAVLAGAAGAARIFWPPDSVGATHRTPPDGLAGTQTLLNPVRPAPSDTLRTSSKSDSHVPDVAKRQVAAASATGASAPMSTPESQPEAPVSDFASAAALWRAGRHAAAFPHLKHFADSGIPQAMGLVGVAYLRGRGVTKDTARGIGLLRDAAGKRDLLAIDTLAAAYENGIGVRYRLDLARHWYRVAADVKHEVNAMRSLGRLYRSHQDYDSAFVWYWKAAGAGSYDAKVEIAEMYEQGQGGKTDLEEARRLYREAADAGSVRGMVALGRIYQEGVGVAPDTTEAIRWYLKAKDAGSTVAAAKLAELGVR